MPDLTSPGIEPETSCANSNVLNHYANSWKQQYGAVNEIGKQDMLSQQTVEEKPTVDLMLIISCIVVFFFLVIFFLFVAIVVLTLQTEVVALP